MAKTSKFLQQQKLAVGVFGVLLLTIVGYLTWVTVSGPGTGELVEGESYELIENPRRIRGDKIEVMEFFSYGCVHCYNFDEELHEWVESQGDRVNFVRMPAIANDQWRLLGQHYYTMEALDVIDEMHTPTFRVIHEGRRILNSEDDLAALWEQQGQDVAAFRETFNSASVVNKLERADQMARRLQVAAVPTLVVQGKYMLRTTRTMGPTRMLEVMSELVEKELTEPQP